MMRTILCYGDSNTFGYMPLTGARYRMNERWTGLLQAKLGEEYRVIEEGCSGRTTVRDDPKEPWKNGLSYLKACLHTHKPLDLVILMLGSNDLKICFQASPREIAEDAGTLIRIIQEFLLEKQGSAPQIILVSPPALGEEIRKSPFYGGDDGFDEESLAKSKEFPGYYRRISDRYGCAFVDAARFVRASAEDQLHLTAEGHAVLSEVLCDAVLKLEQPPENAETIMRRTRGQDVPDAACRGGN
ncbi:MAG: SGNH/GDSL hydrolase family protein [Eubacteriales bacterium]|nr:SGNH/GDSL hydrolase family protein [Eubacteriales bacterium]